MARCQAREIHHAENCSGNCFAGFGTADQFRGSLRPRCDKPREMRGSRQAAGAEPNSLAIIRDQTGAGSRQSLLHSGRLVLDQSRAGRKSLFLRRYSGTGRSMNSLVFLWASPSLELAAQFKICRNMDAYFVGDRFVALTGPDIDIERY